MRVAFMFYGSAQTAIARRMIESVRKHMLDATVVQLTDTRTRGLPEVDEVRRVEGSNYAYLLFKHMAMLPEPFIRLDYDMIVQGDLSHVLDGVDLAFNLHGDPIVTASEWGQKYPYAACIWAARNHGKEFAESFRGIHILSGRDDWLGVIPSVNEAIEASPFAIRALDGAIYNYPPKDREDMPKDALVLHYKGKRKKFMLPKEQEHLVRADEKRISNAVRGYQFET